MKNYRKLFLLLISLLTAGSVVLACWGGSGGPPDDGSMFTPEIINKPHLSPFFRTRDYPLYGEGYYTDHLTACNSTNVAEWKGFLGSGVTDAQLNYWLYKATLKETGNMLLLLKGKKATLNDSSSMFSLLKLEPKDKATTFFFYLGFAKRNEKFVPEPYYSWEPRDTAKENQRFAEISRQIEGGLKLLNNAKSDFIKERYIFQITRLYYYQELYDEAISFYNKSTAQFSSGNSMKWRAMGYAAAAYRKKKNYAQANYFYSLIYNNFEEQQLASYLSFRPQDDKDWEQCLALAKSSEEKSVLWQLYGLRFDKVKAMKEIYKTDPKTEMLEVLLTRAVNREEEKYYDSWSNEAVDIIGIGLGKPDEELRSFVSMVAKEKKVANALVWNLAAAYLHYGAEDYATGDIFLKAVLAEKNTTALIRAQSLVISLFGKLKREQKMTPETEKKLLPEIKELLNEKNPSGGARVEFARVWTRAAVALLYLGADANEKAEMVQRGAGGFDFDEIADLNRMIAYYQNPVKTEMEKFFLTTAGNAEVYIEQKGIRFLQKDMLDSAVAQFEKLNWGSETLPANPFNARIRDCHDCDRDAVQKIKYSKLTFAKKMLEMKNKTKAGGTDLANNYFLMANGFYNTTYYGNCRMFYQIGIRYYSQYDKKTSPQYDCSLALKYYLLAAQNSKDREFRAKCYTMASKCEYYYSKDNTAYKNPEMGGSANYYYTKLKKEFDNTKYEDELIKECSWYRNFTNK